MREKIDGRDWMSAAAGDEVLAEELRTGRCRCGKLLSDEVEDEGCRWHEAGRERVASVLRAIWTGVGATGGVGPRGEDLELLGRYLPTGFLFAYEILIHRAVVLSSSRGYDSTVQKDAGRPTGGLGSTRSETVERRIGAGGGSRKFGGSRDLVRDEASLEFRRRIDRKLRKLGREMLVWLEGTRGKTTYRRCGGRKCGAFADEEWNYCPKCGAATEERDRRGPRS